MTNPAPPVGLLLSDDLIFISRVTGTARDLGFAVQSARSAQALLERARELHPVCVLVDLANPGLDITQLIAGLRASCDPMPHVVAYGSHVDTATLHKARQAGCHVVLPRSKFVEDLPVALPTWMTNPGSSSS